MQPDTIIQAQIQKTSSFNIPLLIGTIISCTLIIIAVIVYVGFKITNSFNHATSAVPTAVITTTTTPTQDPFAGWQSYTDPHYGYMFKYPSNWSLDTTKSFPQDHYGPTEYTKFMLTSPNGYYFSFSEDSSGIQGGSTDESAKYTTVTIDNHQFYKDYVTTCVFTPTEPPSDPCIQQISAIYFTTDKPLPSEDGYRVAPTFTFNNNTMTLQLVNATGNNLVITDPEFIQLDATLDKIIQSFKLPTK